MAPSALHIYLFQQGTDFTEAIKDGLELQSPHESPGFDCRIVSRVVQSGQPVWADYVSGHFHLELPHRSTAGAALLIKLECGLFAATFGDGYRLICEDRVVRDFGLRVLANDMGENSLRGLSSMTVATDPRTTEQQRGTASNRYQFHPGLVREWVRRLKGHSSTTGRVMEGGTDLQRPLAEDERDIERLPGILTDAFRKYEAVDYEDAFGFIDNVRPVPPSSRRAVDLDKAMLAMLRSWPRPPSEREMPRGFTGRVGCAVPDEFYRFADNDVAWFRIHGDRQDSGKRAELTLEWIAARVNATRAPPLTKLQVRALDSHEEEIEDKALRHFVTAEMRVGKQRYAHLAGNWVEVGDRFYRELDDYLRGVKDLTGELGLPKWTMGDHEGTYNAQAAREGEVALLDKKLFQPPRGNRGTVEIADLLTPDLHLICVKKLGRSATLSHLFAQGSVSARLCAEDATYRESIAGHYRDRWGVDLPPGQQPTVVFALGTEREDYSLARTLPFFSKVNLRDHLEALSALPAPITGAVMRIPMVHPRPHRGMRAPRASTRAPQPRLPDIGWDST